MGDENGWTEWKNHVLLELERIAKKLDEVHEQHQEVHSQINQEIASLKTTNKVNATWVGFLAGLVGAAAAVFFDLFKK